MTLLHRALAASLVWLCCGVPARAQTLCADPVALAVSVQGNVDVRPAGTEVWKTVVVDDGICAGDSVTVHRYSRAVLRLEREQTNVQLGDGALAGFPGTPDQARPEFELVKGSAHIISRTPQEFRLRTPFMTVVTRGSEFVVGVDEQQAVLSLLDGVLTAENEWGQTALLSGQDASARSGAAPVANTQHDAQDAVAWALYYPHVFEFQPRDITNFGLEAWRSVVADSARALRANDLKTALTLLESAGDDITSSRYLLYRAHLLLMVGRVAEVQADIEKVLARDATSSVAWVIRSVIAASQGRTEFALESAQQAVRAQGDFAPAHLAMSYAWQAKFDWNRALAAALVAAKKDEDSALAWARVAELQLMHGRDKAALLAVQRALKLNPRSAQAQTVLGYFHLMQLHFDQADAAFNAAVHLDSSAPLPRLGWGLLQIRQGDLPAGRSNIEIATSLDPRGSLLRSYVGKAYYDEKRDALAARQFAYAKALDPTDPTPWFYDAVRKATVNQPLDALQDAQSALALNSFDVPNRSRLLLDEDRAAKTMNPAHLYQALGFGQAAVADAYRAMSRNPGDAGVQRFMAESIALVPHQETTRLSTALQSQLLQPVIARPIPPGGLETPLSPLETVIVPGAGYGEYGALILRNGFNVNAVVDGGGDHSNGDELQVVMAANRVSLAVGRMRFDTKGFRDNADFERSQVNAVVQTALTADTQVQVEWRVSDADQGDTSLRFNPDDYSSTLRQGNEFSVSRLGWAQHFSPDSFWLGSVSRRDESVIESETQAGTLRALDTERTAYAFEFLFAWRGDASHHRLGMGRLFDMNDGASTVTDPLAVVTRTTVNEDAFHNNFYYYAQWQCCGALQLTTGLTWEYFRQSDPHELTRYQFNPKVGLQWNGSATTLRMAVFRTLQREIVSRQTLEPVQVAGFSQYFDDEPAADARVAGIGLDHRFANGSSAGLDFTGRRLVIPHYEASAGSDIDRVWNERTARSYLAIPVSAQVALSLEYFYERYARDAAFTGTDRVAELSTLRFPVGIRWFTPQGFSLTAQFTHIAQAGVFEDALTAVQTDGRDEFWTADLLMAWRFPQRWGQMQLGVRNLTDQHFNYQEMDDARLAVYPQRMIYSRLSINF